MKPIISILLVLSIVTSLGACSFNSGNTPDTQGSGSTETTNETTEPNRETNIKQLPMFSVSLPITTQTSHAEDGTILFNYSYQSISLIGPEPDVADAVILNFLNHIDSTVTSAESIKEFASEYYIASENWSPYFYEIIYSPSRLDQAVLSLYGRTVSFSGAAHPETHFDSINYDLTTGKVLKLTDIILTDTSADALYDAVIKALSEIETTEQLYNGYEEFVLERFNKSLSNDRCWHFDPDGLVFYFSPYEIGPYASGDISVTIPYSDLVGVLKDEYFPVETENAYGEIIADDFSGDLSNNFSQFSEINLKDNERKFVLYTDSYVRDIAIYTGSWSDISGAFGIDNKVFYANSLTPGDAIMVESELNTEFPSLYLTYNSNGKTVEYLIMLDKQTNKVKLIAG